MVIYMYITPGQGQSKPWSQFLFQIIKNQSICQFIASSALHILKFFPSRMNGQPKLTLPKNRSWSSKGHDL